MRSPVTLAPFDKHQCRYYCKRMESSLSGTLGKASRFCFCIADNLSALSRVIALLILNTVDVYRCFRRSCSRTFSPRITILRLIVNVLGTTRVPKHQLPCPCNLITVRWMYKLVDRGKKLADLLHRLSLLSFSISILSRRNHGSRVLVRLLVSDFGVSLRNDTAGDMNENKPQGTRLIANRA